MFSTIGIIVPTLGNRPEYLIECLKSIRAAGDAFVLVVAPEGFDPTPYSAAGLVNQSVKDPGLGLAEAINVGIEALPAEVLLVNWLGDDDLLSSNSLELASDFLMKNSDVDLVFGSCDYIDTTGSKVWTNKSGQWAVPLLRFGPDMIPQPGALFRRSFFNRVGRANPDFGLAFDFELLIRMSKAGRLKFLNKTLASFRWHPESLSVEQRKKSVMDASRSRVAHLPAFLRFFSFLWEIPVRQATLWAGSRVTTRARRLSRVNI
jgi:GT2 family glycosyltransferase